MPEIRKAAVIGAGTMGAGIAAHFANAGIDVVLLDIDAALARTGVERQQKSGGLMLPTLANRIATGSTAGDLATLADADWIVEAVAERLDIKRALYAQIDAVRKPDAIVSSNTSTIRLAELVEGLPENFAYHFLITHFFNPPRQMRLMELVAGDRTSAEVVAAIRDFADLRLGKSVVDCRDTPGFIANRIGCFWLAAAQAEGIALGVDIEDADAALGAFGIPSTGAFGLLDLIGVDLIPYILRSLHANLPASDPLQSYSAEPPLVSAMLAAGRTGRKGGAGFYRRDKETGNRSCIDLASGEYRPQHTPLADKAHAALAEQFATRVMFPTLAYAVGLAAEIAPSIGAIDEAMRLGYAWKQGPFELIDRLGPARVAEALAPIGVPVPPLLALAAAERGFYRVQSGELQELAPAGTFEATPQVEGKLALSAVARRSRPVRDWTVARLWDLGDGVAGLELATKLNTFDLDALGAVGAAVDEAGRNFGAMIIGSDAATFSAGANLRTVLELAQKGDAPAIEALLLAGQAAFGAIKYSRVPVVAAVAGPALGGGCEVALHCAAIEAHVESQIGLVETRVGLIPGWGGCTQILDRLGTAPGLVRGPVAPGLKAFELIGAARMSANALDARALGFLRVDDGIVMNRDRLLARAKARALELAPGYEPPKPTLLALSGPSGASAMRNVLDGRAAAGELAEHDRAVGDVLIGVLSGGQTDPTAPVAESGVLALERAGFLELISTRASQDRILHMVETGKALRN